MAELTQKERLQPSLLDRLADDEPPKRLSRVRSGFCRYPSSDNRSIAIWVAAEHRMSRNHPGSERLPPCQTVGIELRHSGSNRHDDQQCRPTMLERVLRQAILAFEPRILKNITQDPDKSRR